MRQFAASVGEDSRMYGPLQEVIDYCLDRKCSVCGSACNCSNDSEDEDMFMQIPPINFLLMEKFKHLWRDDVGPPCKCTRHMPPGTRFVRINRITRTAHLCKNGITSCAHCKTEGGDDTPIRRCSHCLSIGYCSRESQTADWKLHSPTCKKIYMFTI